MLQTAPCTISIRYSFHTLQFLATGLRLRDRWRLRHLPLVTPVPFLLGHLHNFRRKPIYLCCEKLWKPLKRKALLSCLEPAEC